MEDTVFEEYKRLIDFEPEILDELIQELNAHLHGGPMRGYVYLMRFESGYYKLGLSKNPPTRKKQLLGSQQGLEVDIQIVHTIETDDMYRLERETANKFNQRSQMVGNEMWDLYQEDIDLFCSFTRWYYEDKESRNIPIF